MNIRRIVETAFYPVAFIACVGIAMLIDACCHGIPDVAQPTPHVALCGMQLWRFH